VVEGEIVVRLAQPAYTLRELLGKVTPENRHGETDWGPPQGREQSQAGTTFRIPAMWLG